MRIIAGQFKGAKIKSPEPGNRKIRPSSDLLRESIFNILSHHDDGEILRGTRVLNLFSGTGAMGIEALSRGARYCLFVEKDNVARALIQHNVKTLGLTEHVDIFAQDATQLGNARMEPFSLLCADPPYNQGLATLALAAAASGGWLIDGALCVVEELRKAQISWPAGFTKLNLYHYGKTQVILLRWNTKIPQ